MFLDLVNAFRRSHTGRKFKKYFFIAGEFGRFVVLKLRPGLIVSKKISQYGPYDFDGKYMFSDFSRWSSAHNAAFDQLIEECRGKNCVIDIGAHIGLVSLPMSEVISNNGMVYAFEASPTNATYLQRHLEINNVDRVEVITKAVGEYLGSVMLRENNDVSGMNSIVNISSDSEHRPMGYSKNMEEQIITVPVTTIDVFCRERNIAPDIIKIDVEGAELMVLNGARNILNKASPVIYLSVHPRQLITLGGNVEQLRETIDTLGYRIFRTDGTMLLDESLEFSEYVLSSGKTIRKLVSPSVSS